MQEKQQQVKEKAKGFSISLFIVLALLMVVILAFAYITQEIVIEKEGGFDTTISTFIRSYRSNALTSVMEFLTFFGSSTFLLPAYIGIVAFFLFIRKQSRNSIGIAAIALCGIAIQMILKNIFKRSRPTDQLIAKITNFSYPSGHSFSAFTFAGIIIYFIWKSRLRKVFKWILTICMFLFAFFIAVSRVYLQVHYPSDVVAGFCVSMLWLSISYYVLGKLNFI